MGSPARRRARGGWSVAEHDRVVDQGDELTEHQQAVVALCGRKDLTDEEMGLLAACFDCGSTRHHDCHKDPMEPPETDGNDGTITNRWSWYVHQHSGWTYRVDRFSGGLYEIVRERIVAAYGDLETLTRDMARLANGSVPIDCPSCGGNGMVRHGTPGRDCPHCDSGTLWADMAAPRAPVGAS